MFLFACGQKPKQAAADETKTKLPTHVNIPGTRVFIIPPEGFSIDRELPAISKGEIAIVQATDLPDGNYFSNARNYSKENFEARGVKLIQFKELKISGYPAKMAVAQPEPEGLVYQAVFGDSTFSVMLMGACPIGDQESIKQVEQAIMSVYYDKSHKIDPFAGAPFKIDDSGSGLKFTSYNAGSFLYSINGVKKKEYDDEPVLMISVIPFENETLEEIAAEISPLKNIQSKDAWKGTTNNLPAFKRQIEGELKGKAVVLYQHIIQIGSVAVAVQGFTNAAGRQYIAEFEKLSNTITKK